MSTWIRIISKGSNQMRSQTEVELYFKGDDDFGLKLR